MAPDRGPRGPAPPLGRGAARSRSEASPYLELAASRPRDGARRSGLAARLARRGSTDPLPPTTSLRSPSPCSPPRSRARIASASLDAVADGSVDLVIGTHALVQEAVTFADLQPRRDRRAASVRAAPTHGPEAQGGRGRRADHDRDADPADARPHLLRRSRRGGARRASRRAGSRSPPAPSAPPPSAPPPTTSFATRWRPAARRSSCAPRSTRATGPRSRPPRPRPSGSPPRCSPICGSSCSTVACARRTRRRSWSGSASGEADLLISTTVIEVGVDVPNATVMLVENAERFGLAQLHQLRGRIGRGEHPSTCILFDESDEDNLEARARIDAMVRTTDGFELADEDLRLRGEGTLFDTRQSGMPDLRLARLAEDMPLVGRARARAFAPDRRRPRARAPPRAPRRAPPPVRALDRLAVPLLARR